MGFVAGIKARWAMDALRSAATGLALIPHRRKAVLLVTQGLPVSVEDIITNSNASDAFQALRDFILTAQRSNIAVYTMDPCGLDQDAGCSTYSRQNLQTLAEATGGFSVTNTNAPEAGVDRMIAETGTYYLIGYSSPAPPYDGKRHRIKVRTRESGHQVRARESYISPRRAPQAKAAPSAIDALVEAPIQSRGLTMRIAAVPAPLATKPGATIAVGIELLAADAARAGSIDFTLVAVDSNGKVYTRQRSRSTFQAKGAPPAGWARLGSRVDVPPGRYQIRLAAVGGNGTGGSVFTEVTVPKFTNDLAIGGLSLGSPALRTEQRAEAIASVLPLVPLPTREFPAATALVAQLPIRATANGDAAINIETRLLRNDRDPMVLPAPSGRAGGVHRAGRCGLSGAATAEPGCWRLSPDRRRRVRPRSCDPRSVVQSAAEALMLASLFPHPEQPPHQHQLADVIRAVVDDQDQLSKIGLAAAVRDLRLEIEAGIGRQLLERLAIRDERVDRSCHAAADAGAGEDGQ